MKLLVLGNGFLGQEFARHGYRVAGRDEFEFIEPHARNPSNQLRSLYKMLNDGEQDGVPYDAVVNCIGKANTRWCEDPENWKDVFLSNTLAVGWLSDQLRQIGKKFVHISTGCLYSDDRPSYNPIPETGHIETHCRYTVSKSAGENLCSGTDLVLRPRLLFSDIEHPANLICKLRGFKHYIGNWNSATSTATVVGATEALVGAGQSGVFNVAQKGGMRINKIAALLGFLTPRTGFITETRLREEQGLYLVNNILDIGKLREFHEPATLSEELVRCRDVLAQNSVAPEPAR